MLLTRQFRMPAYLNGHPDGMLIEAPAGLLDDEDAETAIRREAEEETGYRDRAGAHEVLPDPHDGLVERGEIVDGKTVLLLRLAQFA